ncbi:MAG: ABC transporter permease [Xanthomonadales bacterium]|nr:ABC transporter permease [Gammaproteobacteria bacterium]MBT8051656.1 ABC transporter permease [Gammaproteobacteria bacterium]MBT8057647.1 ABC transporter permease [Gammaproteobacteria bacterium]NNJ77761.1 ABC transporter permease [Xanthomonadales bacterium]NNL05270.1 ABC transporter permease [Xanthomonadales bacterium]
MAGPFNWLAQILSIAVFNLRTLPQRVGSSLTAIFGIAGVVAVMVGVLSIAQGIMRTMERSASPENVVVLRSGANSEMMSILMGDDVRFVSEAPGVAREDGDALASPELYVIIDRVKKGSGTDANVPLRGITPPALEVHKDFRILEGRMFEWGLNEVVVGVGARGEFEGLEVGDVIEVARENWPVVGVFDANGGIAEAEIWVDAAVLQPAYQRGNSFQSVYARLESPDAFQAFKDALTSDPRLNVKAMREADYYAEQSGTLYTLITTLGTLIAVIMGLGAVFGALNTMYTAVASRAREIATLRALGFHSGPVVVSVLLESVLLALLGGVIGALLAWWAFDGFSAATLNWSSFSQLTFAFDVSFALLVNGIVFALIIGLVGGLFPALRAARMPIANALREQ